MICFFNLILSNICHPLLVFLLSDFKIQAPGYGHKLIIVDLLFVVHIDSFESIFYLLFRVILSHEIQVADHDPEALHADRSLALKGMLIELLLDPLHHIIAEFLFAGHHAPLLKVHHACGFGLTLLIFLLCFLFGLLVGDLFKLRIVLL